VEEVPRGREEFGFQRTECPCPFCRVPCRHMPGSLCPSDLARLCPAGQDVFAWAEQHLRALADRPFPTLVPARQANGHCHWLHEGRCTVHEAAPYGCAFFDSHMTAADVERREAATVRARREDAAADGLYYRVWVHLRMKGLIALPGDRAAVRAEALAVRRNAERSLRRVRGA
jgi:transposase